MNRFTATYSPEDNKLRLSSASRLEPALYLRVKEAGFRWAPRQEVFVAPMWTPEREDLLLELAGEVGDEDTSLVQRAEDRAERFEEYRESRLEDAEGARKAVAAIADNIPLGQPILVGHHSEKHARRDAQRIEDGMRRAVRMWDTAQYWKSRAIGALRHARYKERPEVRHRRIKTLGADKRRMERQRAGLEGWRMFWAAEDLTREKAVERLRHGYGDDALHKSLTADEVTLEQVVEQKAKAYGRTIERVDRWIAHYDNRITYETAMLDEQIGTGELGQGMAGRFDVAIGGQVLVRGEWCVVLKVNKGADGKVNSVTTTAPKVVTWTKRWNVEVEKIVDYQPPTAEFAASVKKATALPPLCNYPGDAIKTMTAAEWKRVSRSSDSSHIRPIDATPTAGRHRARFTMLPGWTRVQVFVSDLKVVNAPAPLQPDEPPEPTPEDKVPLPARCPDCGAEVPTIFEHVDGCPEPRPETVDTFLTVAPLPMAGAPYDGDHPGDWLNRTPRPAEVSAMAVQVGDAFEAMRQAAKDGVEVVVVRNLFPTPAHVADRVVSLLGIEPGDRVLEPSAGTGQLLEAVFRRSWAQPVTTTAIEVNLQLAALLRSRNFPHTEVLNADFLECSTSLPTLGRFDKVLMNPPFEYGADIRHVEHALSMLKGGGRLVAIMAYGPRQVDWIEMRDDVMHWESLEPGTFEGTQVRAMIAVFQTVKHVSREEAR